MLRPTSLRPISRGLTRSPSSLTKTKPTCAGAGAGRRGLTTAVAEEKDPVELDQITTLPNGLRIATEALPGHFSGIGVYVDAGSRYENEALRGVSHIVDRLAFKSTVTMAGDEVMAGIDALGGNVHCASSRESIMYQAATFNSAVPNTIGLLAETIRDPLVGADEVEQQLETAEYEIGEIWSKPELILPELVHMAAYKDNTLGNPLLCPKERLPYINRQVVDAYRKEFFKPERMVVAFAGVEHGEAVRLAEKYFGDMEKSKGASLPEGDSSGTIPIAEETTQPQFSKLFSKIPFMKSSAEASPAPVQFPPIDTSIPAHYTGGFLTLPPIPPPLNPALPRLSHIHLAFEAYPVASSDIYPLATLQVLLGGGGSFSAGGPGKGMYSRLYTNVLNQHGWVESCIAYNHAYADSGLFGISSSCAPAQVSQMLEVMCRELSALGQETGYAALKQGEVQRAKNQLRSSLLMNMESRMVELEDLGRQVQIHGRKVGVKEMCSKIEAVTVQDLRRVARHVFGGGVNNAGQGTGAPTVVLQEGEQEGLRRREFTWDDIQTRIARWKLGRR
ncbi:mitochondrial-processing peptidase-like protein subunit alpha [Massarina eburnea CBS 473.64]|uniref:Mitochondrial-processing peptidase subunit alpha n=1 Tax=Massarina eburnea CBS 473.64 TaxID=1395130 RepID=A0A6A6RLD1_9PLEO|nr:mitochondrial-processing peptidase-like protein subunit alpha [Massarina eburnea CBS 473.64]